MDVICSPVTPADKDWSTHYPSAFGQGKRVEIADVGCGYGGLLVGLSPVFPDRLILGMEIRDKVVQYVDERIEKLREKEKEADNPTGFQNISVLKTNAMKYLPNFFERGQLQKIFFLFPDPHFKKANHKRRIISTALLAEYAYVLSVGGLAYFISDVEELYLWMLGHFSRHLLFERVDEATLATDPCIPLIVNSTEEARKVNRIDGKKWYAVFRRLATPRPATAATITEESSTTTTTTTSNTQS
eukprot:gene11612-13556_t